jgi:PLP dependent protein
MSDRDEILKRLQENVTRVKEEIATCCLAANRDVSSVKLVAVTKYVDARIMRLLFEAGCTTMGENRGDSLRDKVELLDDLPIEFHFIGHLQRNKIKWVLPSATLIHSVDSLRLMEALNFSAIADQRECQILLEVNISGEVNKNGLSWSEVADVVNAAHAMPGIRVCGFMGMAGLESTRLETQQQFESLANLAYEILPKATAKDPLSELSMGMSHDFDLAIAAGATLLRIGSRLFEGLI